MIQINTTNVNILTLLSQGNFSSDDLSLYLNLEKKSISKNINQINLFLQENKFKTIETDKNGLYILPLSKKEWTSIFSRKDFITTDEITDYLYIKFIHNGFINLESEREALDLSRSSIIRYFNDVKKILNKNSTEFTYLNGKGLKILNLSQQDKNIFCKKLMKIFIKTDFTLNRSFFIKELLVNYDLKKLLNHLYHTFKEFDILSSHFTVSFLCSLYVCVEVFQGFEFKLESKCSKKYEIFKEYIEKNFDSYSPLFREQLFTFLLNIQNKAVDFEPEIIDTANLLIESIKKELNIDNINSSLQTLALKKICFSIFKYNNYILKVKKLRIDKEDRIILGFLDKALSDNNINLFFYDKISIVNILKKVVLELNKSQIKNVLLLFNEIVIADDIYLQDNLKLKIPYVNFHIEPSFFYKLNPDSYTENYDLILSDENYLNPNVQPVNSYNYMEVLDKINEFIFNENLGKS